MNNRSKHFQYMSTHIAAFKKKLARDKHTLILYYIIYTFTVFFVVLFFFRIFEWDHWEKRWKRVCHYYFFFLKKNKFWNMFMLFFYCKRHLFLSRNLHTHTKKQFVVRPCFLNVCSFLFVPFFSYLHENQHTHTLLRIKKAITISKRQEPSVHRDGQWRHWEKRFRFVLLVEKKSLTAEIHERSATT